MKPTIRFDDNEELLDIRYDHIFKAVFTINTTASKGALSDLISTLIERKVPLASITANEPPMKDIRDKSIRFDISCKTESGELVNIEMSLKPASCEPVRLEYYAGRLFTRQNIRGVDKGYSNLKEAYQIAIWAGRCFFKDEELVHRFEYYDPARNVSFGGRSRIITLELAKSEHVLEKSVTEMASHESWAVFFQYLTNRGKREKINEIVQRKEGIAMASEVLINITREDIEWARQLSEEKYILDRQMMIYDAKQEGLQEGRLEIAKNLKANGISVEIIAQSTGLSFEEVENV